MELSEKQKMLGAALFARHISKEATVYIMMLLDEEEDIDDLTWYMGQNPSATEKQLMAVASQLVKERRENN
jgi:hypothetical protein